MYMWAWTYSKISIRVDIGYQKHDKASWNWNQEEKSVLISQDQPRSAMFQWRTERDNHTKQSRDGGSTTLGDIVLLKHTGSGFVKWSLALAQQQSETVIAAERLHQRALEGNGGIKMGTAGTYRRAECFFFFFTRPLFHMCSTCASQSLAPNTRPAGSTILADWKLPWWRCKPALKMGGHAVNLNMVFF